jgi:hypothetical protein
VDLFRALMTMQIVGPTELLDGDVATYQVKLTYDDGTTETTDPDAWSASTDRVNIAANGRLTLSDFAGQTVQITLTATVDSKVATLKVNINTPVIPVPGEPSGFCFIATAAYGSTMDVHVATLQQFRDERLMTNALGRAFVQTYYTISPPMAQVIARDPILRGASRAMLAPVVVAVTQPMRTFGAFLAAFVVTALIIRRHRKDRSCR